LLDTSIAGHLHCWTPLDTVTRNWLRNVSTQNDEERAEELLGRAILPVPGYGAPAAGELPSPQPRQHRHGVWRASHGTRARHPATGATGTHRLLLCFVLFLKGCGDTVALVAGARAFSCVLAERRQRGQPRQAACGGASRWPSRIGQPPAERRRRRGGRRHPACGGGQSTITPSISQN
jgi:hypothetical protein